MLVWKLKETLRRFGRSESFPINNLTRWSCPSQDISLILSVVTWQECKSRYKSNLDENLLEAFGPTFTGTALKQNDFLHKTSLTMNIIWRRSLFSRWFSYFTETAKDREIAKNESMPRQERDLGNEAVGSIVSFLAVSRTSQFPLKDFFELAPFFSFCTIMGRYPIRCKLLVYYGLMVTATISLLMFVPIYHKETRQIAQPIFTTGKQ